MSASKSYLKAASLVAGERNAMNALVFLSQSALFKAEQANSMIQAAAPLTTTNALHGARGDSLATPAIPSIPSISSIPDEISLKQSIKDNDVEQIGRNSLSGRAMLT